MNVSEMVGKRYGYLTVLHIAEKKDKSGRKYLVCKCDCGNVKIIAAGHVRSGASKSCGCKGKEAVIKRCTTHGKSNSRLFTIWQGIKRRCNNQNDQSFDHYGGRGISMCKEWSDDFQSFYEWSMSNGYSDDLTIDRIDVNGNYEPSNCRWATRKTQSRNKRNNHFVSINGVNQCISDWCKVSPVSMTTIYQRIRNGWDIEKAILLPNQRCLKAK